VTDSAVGGDFPSRLSGGRVGYNVAPVEEPIVERLRRGDQGAFDEVYHRHTPGLFAFLARMCGRPAIAEELLQETWLRFARHARALPAGVNLNAWLFTIARNLCRSHQRWRLVDLGRLRGWRTAAAGVLAPSPHELVVAAETERRLEGALAALPAALREMVCLVAVERFSPTEAAGIVGVTPQAARQRLHRARALIGRALADDGFTMGEPTGETS
jgi:RNA polymerase sigma factor (sigma-70 family)